MVYHNITRLTGATGVLLLLLSVQAQAQFSAGSSFHVTPGTQLFIDSLTLQPLVTGLDLSNTTFSVSAIPIPPGGSGTGSIARVYQFNPAISFRGIAGMYYHNTELNGNAAGLLSMVYEVGNGAFTGSAMTTTNNVNNYVEALTGINTIQIGRVTSVESGVPLPLELLYFNAKADGNRTALQWATAQEINFDHFEVERSADGRSYQFLLAEDAAGDSREQHNYSTYDVQPLQGWNYYRLKQADRDGSASWSQVAAVYFGGSKGTAVSVYPNPVQHKLSIALNSEKEQSSALILMDATGRIMKSEQLQLVQGDNNFSLDTDGLAAGSYLLKIGDVYQTKIVKEK